MELEETPGKSQDLCGEISSKVKEVAVGPSSQPERDSKFEHLNLISSSAAGSDPNYKKTKTQRERDHPYRQVTKNDKTFTLGNFATSSQLAESVISAILYEAIQKIVDSEGVSDVLSGKVEAANQQDRLEERTNGNNSDCEHLINTADSSSPVDLDLDHLLHSESNMKDFTNFETTQSCLNKTALQNWLQTKESEVNAFMSEVNESEQELQNLVEDLADVGSLETVQKSLNFKIDKTKDLPDNLLKTPESLLDDGNTLGTVRLTSPQGIKKEERIADERKSKSKNHKSEQAFKSPLLRRKEIRRCLGLQEACESSDVLEEILTPALHFRNAENYLEGTDTRGTLTSPNNDRFMSYSIDHVDADSNFIDRNSVRNVRNHCSIFN